LGPVVAGVDLNTASARELQQLPLIGAILAERIVGERKSNGLYDSLDDLTRVNGIGPRRVEQLRTFDVHGNWRTRGDLALSWLGHWAGTLLVGTLAGVVASLLVWQFFLGPAARKTRLDTLELQKTTLETLTAFTSARLNALACKEKSGESAIADLNQFLKDQWDAFLESKDVKEIEAIRDSLTSDLLEKKAPRCEDQFIDVGPLPIDLLSGSV